MERISPKNVESSFLLKRTIFTQKLRGCSRLTQTYTSLCRPGLQDGAERRRGSSLLPPEPPPPLPLLPPEAHPAWLSSSCRCLHILTALWVEGDTCWIRRGTTKLGSRSTCSILVVED
ncbi:hypothetical protein XENORESO_012313 [Xenotaenia resolanae]|uniref:Uncharacterized protein n=1 Tax=Xenotaenia resolanae TaxID=208358 RepID=A0ABV0VRZ5_9TELE